jgi:galactitol-specific phosphotransferase system IIB component
MRRLPRLFLFGSALVLTACGDGGSEVNSREGLLEHVKEELERSGASTAMAECTVGELDRRLDLAEVKAAYDKLPDDASDAQVARVFRDSSLNEDTVAAVSVCARKLGLPLPRQ